MNKKKVKVKAYYLLIISFICCTIGIGTVAVGALVHANPKIEKFSSLFKPLPLKNLIYSIIPEFKK